MSDLTFNKVAGALLATGLAIVGLRQLSSGIFATEAPAKPGYAIAVQEGGESGPKVEAPIDWGTVLPAADVNAGAAVFNKCKSCHVADKPKNRVGPSLHGVFGRKAGTFDGFNYSKDMSAAGSKGLVWDDATIAKFVADPRGFLGSQVGKGRASTKMAFAGLKKEKDIEDLIAYLKEVTTK